MDEKGFAADWMKQQNWRVWAPGVLSDASEEELRQVADVEDRIERFLLTMTRRGSMPRACAAASCWPRSIRWRKSPPTSSSRRGTFSFPLLPAIPAAQPSPCPGRLPSCR